MASVQRVLPRGRDFTAEELTGRTIRIESVSDLPVGVGMMVTADGEMVGNIGKIVLSIEPNSIVEATLTLFRFDKEDVPTEEVTLRDNVEVSFSAVVTDVDNEAPIDTTDPEFAQQFKGFMNKPTHVAIEANTEVQ